MRTSDQINELFAALAEAQGEYTVAKKDAENPFFNSSYADFESVVGAARPALKKNGIGFTQMPSLEDGKPVLITRIFHKSGQWIEASAPIKTTKDDAQAFGAAITYIKRYAAQAGLGAVTSDEEDDAEKTVKRDDPQRKASKATIAGAIKAFQGLGVTESQLIKYLGISSSAEMTEVDVDNLKVIGGEIKAQKAKSSDYFK